MLSLFFAPTIPAESTVSIDGEEAHHAIKVMRMEMGDEVLVADGAGAWAQGAISSIDKKSFTVSIKERGIEISERPELIVVQALTKSDRTKESIELLVEAGVDTIIPWESERSIAKWKPEMGEKLFLTARTACKQSRRFTVPHIDNAHTTAQLIKRFSEKSGVKVLVFHESAEDSLSSVVTRSDLALSAIVCVIGPEGGISDAELSEYEAAGAHLVKLGKPVLRSAHAGIAALIAVQALIGRI